MHTKGHWRVIENHDLYCIVAEGVKQNGYEHPIVCEVMDDFCTSKEAKANAERIVKAVNAHDSLLLACRCALADLEGIMPEYDPSGDRTHPGWQTIKDLQKAISEAEKGEA